jgi:Asp/Glu/hydantoin racemase
MLREVTTKPVVGIFEAAIVHALLLGKKFGVVTSGSGWVNGITAGVRNFLGANASDRFAGVSATGLGVLELKEGDQEKVRMRIRESAADVARLGADVILLGCAGNF